MLARSAPGSSIRSQAPRCGLSSERAATLASRMTADDFFAGLFAALAVRGLTTFSIRIDQFDPFIKRVFDGLAQRAAAAEINLRFRINPHPLHQDSLTIQGALARAAQRDLISFDNPEYQDIHIKLARDEAIRVLECLPGGAELYKSLADEFIDAYSGAEYPVTIAG
jgi:hypothetical protein